MESGANTNTKDKNDPSMFQRAMSHAKEFIEASPEDHKK